MSASTKKLYAFIVAVILLVVIGGGSALYIYYKHSNTTNAAVSQPVNHKNKLAVTNKPVRSQTAQTVPDQTTFSTLPQDLQAAVIAKDQAVEPACVSSNQLVTKAGVLANPFERYDMSGSAVIGIPTCDDNAATLFVKSGGSWQVVAQTQFAFNCTLLQQYHVSSAVISQGGMARCLDTTNKEVSYTQ